MKCKFNCGDKVCIRPDYWDILARSKIAIPLYVDNGKDHVYTVRATYEYSVALEEDTGTWNPDYLIPAEEAIPEEPPIPGLTDLL